MLELSNLAQVLSGVSIREARDGPARFVRLSDLSELKAGRSPLLARGHSPDVARALAIEEGDLIIGARGAATDICTAGDEVFGAFISLDLYLVRPNTAVVDFRYLSAFLRLPATQSMFAARKQGSALARLPKEVLEKIQVPLPSLHVQGLIAGLACSFELENKLLKRLSDLNSVMSREVVARAISASDTADFTRSKH